jgi:hypothetical protein
MVFNYDRSEGRDTYDIQHKAARRLLDELITDRHLLDERTKDRKERNDSPPRPIVFIGHSFGGLVIETALILGSQAVSGLTKERCEGPEADSGIKAWQYEKRVVDDVVGIIFLATPFNITPKIRDRWRLIGVNLGSPLGPNEESCASSHAALSGNPSSGPKGTTSHHSWRARRTNPDPFEQSEKGFNAVACAPSNVSKHQPPPDLNKTFIELAKTQQYRIACYYEESVLKDDAEARPCMNILDRHANRTRCSWKGQTVH